jgi:protoporphyrinogen oxidase
MWLPLLRAKLGDNHSLASAAFIWSYIYRLYKARQSGMKREVLGYVAGGYAPVLQRFREHLRSLGVDIRTDAVVDEVQGDAKSATVRLRGGATHELDAVVLTVPSTYVPTLCQQLNAEERTRLEGVVYQGVACASVLLRKPLGGFYVTNITDAWVPYTAVVEMTALVPTSHFGGYTLAYLPRYLTQEDPYWKRSDAEIEREFTEALLRMYSHLTRDDIVSFQVSRARKVQALATLRYQEKVLPRTVTSVPRVFVANSSQIVNGTLNLNETITVANRKAEEIEAALAAG